MTLSPSSAPSSIKAERSSTLCSARGLSTITRAATRRSGGSSFRPTWVEISSVTNTSFRTDISGSTSHAKIGLANRRIGGKVLRPTGQSDASALEHVSARRNFERKARILLHEKGRQSFRIELPNDVEDSLDD